MARVTWTANYGLRQGRGVSTRTKGSGNGRTTGLPRKGDPPSRSTKEGGWQRGHGIRVGVHRRRGKEDKRVTACQGKGVTLGWGDYSGNAHGGECGTVEEADHLPMKEGGSRGRGHQKTDESETSGGLPGGDSAKCQEQHSRLLSPV